MGTWGHGNLDSDYALDELASRSHALVHELLLRAARPTSREGDEYDYTTLFVEFEIVFALEAAGLLAHGALPRPAPVEALALDYLAGWDDNIDELEPTEEHKRERRRKIAETFAHFVELCAKHDAPHKPATLPSPSPKTTTKPPAKTKPTKKTAAPPAKKKKARR